MGDMSLAAMSGERSAFVSISYARKKAEIVSYSVAHRRKLLHEQFNATALVNSEQLQTAEARAMLADLLDRPSDSALCFQKHVQSNSPLYLISSLT
jgi:hypothetical protein